MTAPTRAVLVLPPGWVELDPREPDVAGSVLQMLDLDDPELTETMTALIAPLAVRLRRLATAGEVILVGFYSEIVEVEGGDEPMVITAQVMLALSPPVGGLEKLQEVLGGDGVEVAPIDLPAGPGVVVSGPTEVDDELWPSPQPAHLRRYMIPVPGLSRVAALSFLTPNVDLVEQFDELFDAIAGTLAFE